MYNTEVIAIHKYCVSFFMFQEEREWLFQIVGVEPWIYKSMAR
jgi:hypothetical protein